MKMTILVVLFLLAIGSCVFLTGGVVRLSPVVTHIDVSLETDAGNCKVTKPPATQSSTARPYARIGGLVHWPVRAQGDGCKHKKISIAENFKKCGTNEVVNNPFVDCDPTDTGNLTGGHLYCAVSQQAQPGCYKYSFAGDVQLDPEIEIGGPPNHFKAWLESLLMLFGKERYSS